jgi:hypothetical protein
MTQALSAFDEAFADLLQVDQRVSALNWTQ